MELFESASFDPMNRAQLTGLVFAAMGGSQAVVAIRSLSDGIAVIKLLYMTTSLVILMLGLISICRPEWVNSEHFADQEITWTDIKLAVATTIALFFTAALGYSFMSGWKL